MKLIARLPGEDLKDYLARARAAEVEAARIVPEPTFDADLIPQIDSHRSAEDDDIDAAVRGIDIVQAYEKWCGKMAPVIGNKRESIMVSCPNPQHPDKHPSAWVNLDLNVGNCPRCGGFDRYDLFAWSKNHNVPGYKTDGSFPQLRRDMAADLGYVVKRTPTGQEYVEAPLAEPALAPVISIAPMSTATIDETSSPTIGIDWRSLLDPADSTFLWHWMTVCTEDQPPEEFFFWLGLQAIGLAAGNNVTLNDYHPVTANLLVCLSGDSGTGKTRAMRSLTKILDLTMPWDQANPGSGVKLVSSPGSGESLVDEFVEPEYDPNDPKKIIGYQPVRGLLRMNELSELVGKGARTGSILKPKIIEMFDGDKQSQRSRTHGTVASDNYFFSMVTSTQPLVMRNLLSQDDIISGFVNRWAFACGIKKPEQIIGGSPVDLASLVPMLQKIRAWAGTKRSVGWNDAAATATFEEFVRYTVLPIKNDQERPIFGRIDLLLKKLCLLFSMDKKLTTVTPRTVQQVIDLWPYLVAMFGAAEANTSIMSAELDCTGKIARAVQHFNSIGLNPSARELYKHVSRNKFDPSLVKRVLVNLTELGFIEELLVTGQRGPRTARYKMAAS